VYATCVDKLVTQALQGKNATVLAYGQTGSGKTFTMGTGCKKNVNNAQLGLIPRAVQHIFRRIGDIKCSVSVQFVELYNEKIMDLLDTSKKAEPLKMVLNKKHEVSITNATTKPIFNTSDALT